MQYTISSRSRPIGTTELDFDRIEGFNRSGWFEPNALGEELMPTIALPFPAMRAYVCRDVRDGDGRRIVQPNFIRSSLFADLAEAFHRVQSLELTLHGPDGALIPTSEIGIQDTERLLEMSRWSEEHRPPDTPDEGSARDAELQRQIEHDIELLRADWGDGDEDRMYAADEGELDDAAEAAWLREQYLRLPRYQVHVLLVEENAIP